MTSSKLRLSRVRAEGFRGICQAVEVDFDQHATILSAPNGSGKTSILGAIEWALFGELQYQPKENATNDEIINIRHPARTATVSLELVSEGGTVIFTRSKKAGKRASDATMALPDGTIIEGKEADFARFRMLGLTFDDFYRAVYLHQESIRGLLIDEPRVRNEALDRLFGVEKLRDLLKVLSTKSVRDAVRELEAEQSRATAKLTGAVGQIEDQRNRALSEAEKEGLAVDELTLDSTLELASAIAGGVSDLLMEVSHTQPNIPAPSALEDGDRFVRKVQDSFRTIRQFGVETGAASAAQNIIAIQAAKAEYQRLTGHMKDIETGLQALTEDVGDLDGLEERQTVALQEAQRLAESIERLGVAERIVADTLGYLRSSEDVDTCPACGQGIEREHLISRLDEQVGEGLRHDLEETKSRQSAQNRLIQELETTIERRGRLISERKGHEGDLVLVRSSARTLVETDIDDDRLLDLLDVRETDLRGHAVIMEQERKQREQHIEVLSASLDRFKAITRYLKADAALQEASSRLGGPDEDDSTVTDQQLEALSQIESSIECIASIVTQVASARAREALDGADGVIAEFYKSLCNHPYFDQVRITVEDQRVQGVDRNNYVIRILSSSDAVQSLASSRLSTAQMNCVALSVYLALATHLEHNLGFVVLDDPSQSLDTQHKTALAKVLAQLSPDIQFLVGTQDPELEGLLLDQWGKDSCQLYRLNWSPRTGTAIVDVNE